MAGGAVHGASLGGFLHCGACATHPAERHHTLQYAAFLQAHRRGGGAPAAPTSARHIPQRVSTATAHAPLCAFQCCTWCSRPQYTTEKHVVQASAAGAAHTAQAVGGEKDARSGGGGGGGGGAGPHAGQRP
jgi:hypothetical protein